jgi:lipopolysaccharide transport system ATP-binding protein
LNDIVARFEHVSKKYRLGLTRESLPSLLSRQIRRVFTPASRGQNSHRVHWALRDVSFDLQRGQCLALIGGNGAGKTTILKLLARITRPTSGAIEVHGRLAALIELGAGFHPDLTGRENIFLNGTILGLSRDYVRRHFDEIVAFSELESFIDTPIKRYSSGMAVRLGFSVAACIEPDILLVDEVLAVGDASFREKCLNRIQALLRRGTSIIFVSHNLYMVQAICQKAVYLRKGQVNYAGDTLSVIERYEQDLHVERTEKLERSESDAPSGGVPADITGVQVSGSEQAIPGTLDGQEPAEIRIQYTAYAALPPLNLAVFLIRADGVTCAMLRSKLDQFQVEMQRGSGEVVLSLDRLQLATGTYFAEVELTNETDSMVVKPAPARSAWFSVKGRGRSYDDRCGVFEPAARWVHMAQEPSLQHVQTTVAANGSMRSAQDRELTRPDGRRRFHDRG